MCGRFVASRPVEDIVRLLEVEEVDVPPEVSRPRWNVAPRAPVLAVTRPRHAPDLKRLSVFRWGLVPWWAKDPKIGARAFNAKAETVGDKPMFRGAIESQRCIVPADAFYEWAPATGGGRSRRKQPWCFKASSSGLLLLAGVWEQWRPHGNKSAEPLRTCAILTTEANEVVGPVHDRMPVLLAEEDLDEWLSLEQLAANALERLTRPAPAGALEAFMVSILVSDAREDGPELVEPIEAATGAEAGTGTGRDNPQLF